MSELEHFTTEAQRRANARAKDTARAVALVLRAAGKSPVRAFRSVPAAAVAGKPAAEPARAAAKDAVAPAPDLVSQLGPDAKKVATEEQRRLDLGLSVIDAAEAAGIIVRRPPHTDPTDFAPPDPYKSLLQKGGSR